MSFLPTAQQNQTPTTTGVLRGGPLVVGVEVSVIVSEAHTLSAQATKQSLESGAQVSDHIILEPPSVSIVFEVSNAGDGAQAARDVFDTFKAMQEKRELVEVITEHTIYDNMALVSLSPVHAAPYKGRLQCTAVLQRINQVKIEMAGRSPKTLKGSSAKTGSAEVAGGTQNGKPPKKSWLKQTVEKNSGA